MGLCIRTAPSIDGKKGKAILKASTQQRAAVSLAPAQEWGMGSCIEQHGVSHPAEPG